MVNWYNNKIFKQMRLLIGGSALAQVIALLASPILTRLYPPESFGQLAVFMSTATILSMLFTLQYDAATILPKRHQAAVKLFRGAIFFSLLFTLFSMLMLPAIFFSAISEQSFFLNNPSWLFVIAVLGALSVAVERSCQYWLLRKERFKLIASILFFSVLFTSLVRIIAGVWFSGGEVLIVGFFCGHIVAFSLYLKSGDFSQFWARSKSKQRRFKLNANFDRLRTKALFRKYDDFPKYRMPQQLLNALSQNLPALILVASFGVAVGGLYAMAERIVRLPGRFISEAIRKVFYQHIAKQKQNNKPLFPSLFKGTLGLALLGIVPFTLLFLFSTPLFTFVFGEQWSEAGGFAAWLSIWMYSVFANTPAIAMMPVLRKQKRYLAYNVAGTVLRLASILMGSELGGAIGAIIAFALAGALYNFIIIIDVFVQTAKADQHTHQKLTITHL